MQLFTDRKKLEELENTIKDQELIIFNLRSEIRTLVQKNKELEKNNKLINHIKYLEKQLDSYNPNLKPRKQEIKQCDIDLIKKMYSQNYTYREIKSKTGWSLNTISKVINKFYD